MSGCISWATLVKALDDVADKETDGIQTRVYIVCY